MKKGALGRLPAILLVLILLLAAWLRFYNLYLTELARDQVNILTAVTQMLRGSCFAIAVSGWGR